MTAILIILTVLLILYYALFLINIYWGLRKLTCSENNESKLLPITLIIPFRDEEKVIADNINSIQNLEYPKDLLEVFYIDDGSKDSSVNILEKLISSSNVKLLKLPDEITGSKKRAVEFAIERAGGEIIVSSDADCTYKPQWLKTIISKFNEKTGFVSGPVDINSSKNFFQKFQKIEFIGLILSGAGLIGAGKPTIASAANIAFRKDIFQQIGGYGNLHKFTSGDDELLMHKINDETEYNIEFNFCRDAVVQTRASSNMKEFFEQRKRWASKGLFYQSKLLVVNLIIIYLFYLSIPMNLILGFLASENFFIIAGISLLIKFLFEFLIMEYGCRKLFNPDILKYFLPAQFVQIPYILISAFNGLFGGIKWKGRNKQR